MGHTCRPIARSACFPIWSCSRRGLPCRRVLPPARCALTAPFHPYHPLAGVRRFAFCCTFRGLASPRRYLAPCPRSPDFPPRLRAAIVWPTPARMVGARVGRRKERMAAKRRIKSQGGESGVHARCISVSQLCNFCASLRRCSVFTPLSVSRRTHTARCASDR